MSGEIAERPVSGRPVERPFHRWTAVLVACLLVGTGCVASGGSSPAVSTAHTVARGQSNCPPDQAQDLTFTGSFVGHLTCQSKPSFCFWDPPRADLTNSLHAHLIATIPVLVDGKPASVTVSPGLHYGEHGLGAGTYDVPNERLGGGSPQFDLQLADMSNWQSRAGGRVTVVSDDGKRVAGTVDGTLDGASRATLTGRWTCVRDVPMSGPTGTRAASSAVPHCPRSPCTTSTSASEPHSTTRSRMVCSGPTRLAAL